MQWIFLVYSLMLGVAVGSFLNVVVLRFQTGRALSGRSACLSCASKLAWYDLVPVLSFLILRGRCRSCRSKISWQYPLVEIAGALVFFLITWRFLSSVQDLEAAVLLFYGIISWPLLIAILVYDIRHKIIPNLFVFTLAGLALIFRIIIGFTDGFSQVWLLDILAGPLLYLPFFALWKLSGGKWMGLGDGNLALFIGWSLGLSAGISAVIFGFWLGAGTGILLILCQRFFSASKNLTMRSEIPFAPFLIAGTLLVDLFGYSLFLGF